MHRLFPRTSTYCRFIDLLGLALGGAVGYLMGYLAQFFGVDFQIEHLPTIFAMVGSASMIASVTHTLSSAILVLEISGNYDILFPSMIGTVVAIVVSSFITDDLFTGPLVLARRLLTW